MKIIQKFLLENIPDLKVGDMILVGRFKNVRALITGFGKDSNGQPIIKTTKGTRKLFPFRINKLMPEDKRKKKLDD